jgi:hypothetical protein
MSWSYGTMANPIPFRRKPTEKRPMPTQKLTNPTDYPTNCSRNFLLCRRARRRKASESS